MEPCRSCHSMLYTVQRTPFFPLLHPFAKYSSPEQTPAHCCCPPGISGVPVHLPLFLKNENDSASAAAVLLRQIERSHLLHSGTSPEVPDLACPPAQNDWTGQWSDGGKSPPICPHSSSECCCRKRAASHRAEKKRDSCFSFPPSGNPHRPVL